MFRNLMLGVSAAMIAAGLAADAWAQASRTTTSRTGTAGGVGTSSRTAGLTIQNAGQLSSDAAIQRNATDFVGAAANNFLSRTGTTGGTQMGNRGLLGGLTGTGLMSYGLGSMYGRNMYGNRGFGYNTNLLGMNTMNRTGRGASQLRIPVALGPELASTSLQSTEVSARLENRLPKIPGLKSVSGVAVKMDGKTAVLQGVVATPRERDLIGRLALLEPGISDVRNELEVNPEAAQPQTLPSLEPVPASPR